MPARVEQYFREDSRGARFGSMEALQSFLPMNYVGAHLPPMLVLIVLVGFWAAGFFVFLDKIPRVLPSLELQRKADAIVVLTGGGGRLELGLRLFLRGDAAQLFISGVDPEVDKSALLQNRQVDPTILDCCVTLGHSADDTFGNAAETARWMKSEGFTSVFIVTNSRLKYAISRSFSMFSFCLPLSSPTAS